MKERKIAMILFYDKGGKIILQDRRKRSKWGEEFGFFGGKVEDGENVEEALKREIKEELDFDLEKFELFDHFKQNLVDINILADRYIFLSEMPDLDKVHCKEGEIFITSFEEAFKLNLVPGDKEILERIYEKLK